MGRYSPNLHILVTIILSTKEPLTGKYISQAAEHLHQHLMLLCKYRQLVEEVEVMEEMLQTWEPVGGVEKVVLEK